MNMSKNYRRRKDDKIINFIIFLILLIALTPAIPLTVFFAVVFYHFNIKKKYIIGISSISIILMITFAFETLSKFYEEFVKMFTSSIDGIFTDNKILFMNPFTYSYTSWIYIFLISAVAGCYFSSKMKKNRMRSEVGMKGLNEAIKSTEENNLSPDIPISPKNEMTLIGYNKEKKAVYCDDKAKHIFVCGTTGSGKTVLLLNYIKSGIEKGYGVLIVDGKGDTGNGTILEVTKDFAKRYNRNLYIVNMNDPENSDKYNPFDGANETIIKDMLVNMTDWSEAHYKANAERYIQRLVKLLNIQGKRLSFNSIIQNMPTEKFQLLSALLTKENKISKEQHLDNLELIKASGRIAENASARFSTIAESEIGEIFSDEGIDIYTAMKNNSIVLFVFNPLIYPETSSVMGRLVLIDAKKAISKMFGNSEKRSFFLFDEINVYASTVLIDLINKSRSAGVTCIPATQSLADLEAIAGDAFKQQIIENCNNYIVLRQNSSASAEEWAKTMGTKEMMKMTYQVSDLEATGKGTARRVREFIIHPDEIKALQTGTGIFSSRDTGKCERIKIIKPF